MSNILTRLFKSKATREIEARVEQEKLASASDTGRQMADTVVSIIDAFYDQKLIAVTQNIKNAFNSEMEMHHKDVTMAAAIESLRSFNCDIENMKAQAFEGVWNDIGEWKHILIEMGAKEDFDLYINQKFNAVWTALIENSTAETAYCAARISGHITDQMHGMTPEELGRYARENKLGQFRET
jgi:hypothetical protein